MPKELYNEGRVVGASAYEMYVKHALSEDPNMEPASEREWLAAQLAHGTSMILKVKAHNTRGVHYIDYPLPEESTLLAANTVIASQFFGECQCDDGGWAVKVTDYGQGISNIASLSPSDATDATTYRTKTLEEFSDEYKKTFLQYMKIQDGVILQPGTWTTTEHQNPPKDFIPNTIKTPVVRLIFASKVTKDFYIILTGFTPNNIIEGITSSDLGSTAQLKPENGDFIGPELYPWANKITFSYPPIAAYYLRQRLTAWHEIHPPITSGTATTNQTNLQIQHDEDSIETIFRVSDLVPGNGIAIQPPTSVGGPIYVSSVITAATTNKYLKVTQTPGNTASTSTTTLQISTMQSGAASGVKITQPVEPGQAVSFESKVIAGNNVNENPASSKAIVVTQSNYQTTIAIDKAVINGWIHAIVDPEIRRLDARIDALRTELINYINNSSGSTRNAIGQIVARMGYGTSTVAGSGTDVIINWDGSMSGGRRCPSGTLNIYSSNGEQIECHSGTLAGDVKFN